MIKKRILISIMLTVVLAICWGCSREKNSPGNDNDKPVASEDHKAFKWENTIRGDMDISSVQQSNTGTIFVLSEGVIYFIQEQDWHPINLDEDVSAFCLLDDGNVTKVIAGTVGGNIYVKSIQDPDWQKGTVKLYSSPVDILVANSSDKSLYLGQSSKEGGGLWKSTDLGKTWLKLTDITVRGIAVHPLNPETIYIVDRLTYLSDDGGNNWSRMDTGANYGVLIHPNQPDTAYLAFARGVVTATHDGRVNSRQQFYLPGGMTRLEYCPTNLNQWALGIWDYPSGTGGLYYTFNGGGRWIEVGEEMDNTMVLDLCYSRDGKKLYIGTARKGLWMLNIEHLDQ